MSQRHGWDIRTRMLAISLGPALLLTLLLTAYFTYSRLQDLRQELTHTGQLIADQLAPAAEYGVIAGNTPVLQKLLQATLDTPHVRFIEVRDRNDNILVYVEQLSGALQNAAPIDIFHSTIQRQRIALASDPLLDGASEGDGQSGEDYLGRVVDTLDELLGQAPRHWPLSLYPGHFKVLGNRQVARSLGIDLASDADLGRRLAEGEEP